MSIGMIAGVLGFRYSTYLVPIECYLGCYLAGVKVTPAIFYGSSLEDKKVI